MLNIQLFTTGRKGEGDGLAHSRQYCALRYGLPPDRCVFPFPCRHKAEGLLFMGCGHWQPCRETAAPAAQGGA